MQPSKWNHAFDKKNSAKNKMEWYQSVGDYLLKYEQNNKYHVLVFLFFQLI